MNQKKLTSGLIGAILSAQVLLPLSGYTHVMAYEKGISTLSVSEEAEELVNTLNSIRPGSASAEGNIVTLLKGLTLTSQLVIEGNIILDLAGNTISGNLNTATISIIGDVSIQGNGFITSHTYTAINVEKGSKLTIVNGTFTGLPAISVRGQGSLTVLDGTFTGLSDEEDSYGAIQSNGSYDAATGGGQSEASILIKNGTFSADAVVLYLPSYKGTTTIQGGTFTSKGATCIELRGGSLVVDPVNADIKITGKGTFDASSNTSGSTTLGAGISIAQHTTKDPSISLTIGEEGKNSLLIQGSEEGYAIAVVDPENNLNENNPSLTLYSGTYAAGKAPLYIVDSIKRSGFVYGTNFSQSIISSGYLNSSVRYETENLNGWKGIAPFTYYLGNQTDFQTLLNQANSSNDGYVSVLNEDNEFNNIIYFSNGNRKISTYYLGESDGTINLPTLNVPGFEGWVIQGGTDSTVYKAGETFKRSEEITLAPSINQEVVMPPENGDTGNGGSTNTPTPTPPADDSGTNNGTSGSGAGFTEPGSTTKPNTDGSSTTFTQEDDGTKSATTVDSQGNVTDVQVTIPSTGITDGVAEVDLGTNSAGQKIKIPGNITNDATAPEVTVNLPQNADGTTVQFELRENTGMPGTVAMVEDENGNLVPIVDSIAIGDDFYVPVSGGKTQIVVKDNAKSFTDVAPNQWYDDAVAFVSARGIMNGSAGAGSTTFAPDETLTRAMLAQMIANMDGQPNSSKETNPWYLGAQRYVMGKGLMGVGSPFNPDDPISRQDLAVVLWRNAGSPQVETGILNDYVDHAQVSNYAVQAVAWAVQNEIMGVNSPLNPANDASRAEIARMFMAYITDQIVK